jgi:hypothetical protein
MVFTMRSGVAGLISRLARLVVVIDPAPPASAAEPARDAPLPGTATDPSTEVGPGDGAKVRL